MKTHGMIKSTLQSPNSSQSKSKLEIQKIISSLNLQQEGVACFGVDGPLNSLWIGDGKIVTDELNLGGGHKVGPSRPIILVKRILDGDDGVIGDEFLAEKVLNVNVVCV